MMDVLNFLKQVVEPEAVTVVEEIVNDAYDAYADLLTDKMAQGTALMRSKLIDHGFTRGEAVQIICAAVGKNGGK